jgi:hypothetical protein
VATLGIKATMGDYSQEERETLLNAERVFFPTPRFAEIFRSVEKSTFPSLTTYRYQRSRILQQLLLQYINWPHPKTRIYYGKKQKEQILKDFHLPVSLLGPRAVSGTLHLISHPEMLRDYLQHYNPVIVQQNVPWTERIRLLCVHFKCIGAQRRLMRKVDNEDYEPISLVAHSYFAEPLNRTHRLLLMANLDDIMLEWGYCEKKWQLITMKRPPVRWKMHEGTLNRHHYIAELIQQGFL